MDGVTTTPELLDQLIKGPMTPEEVQAACLRSKKALIERALGGEMTHHLRYRPGEARPEGRDDHRTGFDGKIIVMYARGMTVRGIQGFLAEQYGTEVSPEFISTVTDEVMTDVTAWQNRPVGVLPDGTRDALGIWTERTEGAKFWLNVFTDLKTRGVGDILIAVIDGLKGLTEAIAVALPRTTVQSCNAHLIRSSLDHTGHRDREPLPATLRPIYAAPSTEAAQEALAKFAAGSWGAKYRTIVPSWLRAWTHVILFFALPPAVPRVIYPNNAIDSLHMKLRKIVTTRSHFPSDGPTLKRLRIAPRDAPADTVRSAKQCKQAMTRFAIVCGERLTEVTA